MVLSLEEKFIGFWGLKMYDKTAMIISKNTNLINLIIFAIKERLICKFKIMKR